jgi:hypothetical protein
LPGGGSKSVPSIIICGIKILKIDEAMFVLKHVGIAPATMKRSTGLYSRQRHPIYTERRPDAGEERSDAEQAMRRLNVWLFRFSGV